MIMRRSHYDKSPFVTVPRTDTACVAGWAAVGQRLRTAIQARGQAKTVLTVECYPGVFETDVLEALTRELKPVLAIRAATALQPEPEINRLCTPFLGGEDPVFGYLSNLTLPQFFDPDRGADLRRQIEGVGAGLILVVGVGARWIAEGDLLVYADLARWEIQQRQRRKKIGNLGADNASQSPGLKYKRAFFIDWRVADRWKQPLLRRFDFLLDTHHPQEPKLAEGEAVRRGWAETVRRAFPGGAFVRSGPVGWPVDERGLRPGPLGPELRLVLRLRAGREFARPRLRNPAGRDAGDEPGAG